MGRDQRGGEIAEMGRQRLGVDRELAKDLGKGQEPNGRLETQRERERERNTKRRGDDRDLEKGRVGQRTRQTQEREQELTDIQVTDTDVGEVGRVSDIRKWRDEEISGLTNGQGQ